MAADLRLLALSGDGIGPEIMGASLSVLEAVAPRMARGVTVETAEIGFPALERAGTTIPPAVIAAAKAADGVLLGPVSHIAYPPKSEGGLNPSGVLRKELDLFANIRPARVWPGLAAHTKGPMDVVVVRENLEGFYADRNMFEGSGEFMPVPGVALAVRRITEHASRRIAEAGFRIAAARSAKRVAVIHKANVMRMSDGLFLDTVRDVAKAFPDVEVEEVLVDAAAALMVRSPERFDTIITTNMFGDILSDLASELCGGLGLAGSLNAGPTHAAAQAQHGSAPDIAGRDAANPTSLILSLAMLLRHLGETSAADTIEAALATCLARPETRTRDVGGTLGTKAFNQALVTTIAEAP
ncbi:MAG: isocitrate/isopropylmalate dehydrogenase family protein [Pseudomonadota bacterium]